MENKFEVYAIFIIDKKSGSPFFMKYYKEVMNNDTYILPGYFLSLHVFGELVYNAKLTTEALKIQHLGFISANGNEYEFIFSVNDLVTTVIVVKYTDRTDKDTTKKFIMKKVDEITTSFEETFPEEIEARCRELSRYSERFSSKCDVIIFSKDES